MLLAYVDESYTDEWYYMAGLLVDGPTAISLSAALDRVVAKAVAAHGVRVGAELHGHDLFRPRADWKGLPVRVRVGVYNDVFRAIADHDVRIIIRGVHRPGLANRHSQPEHPHVIVLQHLLERIDECVAALDEFALVIADEVDEPAKHRAGLDIYRTVGTKGYRRRQLTRIVDTLHFAPSHSSRLVQAADMIAFMVRRVERHRESDQRAIRANQVLWGRIRPKVIHNHCWLPDGGKPPTDDGAAGP